MTKISKVGRGAKKTVKRSEKHQYQKILLSKENLCGATILQPLLVKKFSNLRPFLSITFPQGFRTSKNFGHPTLGCGGKKTGPHTDTQTEPFPYLNCRQTNNLDDMILIS